MSELEKTRNAGVGDFVTLKKQPGEFLFFSFLGGGRLKVARLQPYGLDAPFATSFAKIISITGKHGMKRKF